MDAKPTIIAITTTSLIRLESPSFSILTSIHHQRTPWPRYWDFKGTGASALLRGLRPARDALEREYHALGRLALNAARVAAALLEERHGARRSAPPANAAGSVDQWIANRLAFPLACLDRLARCCSSRRALVALCRARHAVGLNVLSPRRQRHVRRPNRRCPEGLKRHGQQDNCEGAGASAKASVHGVVFSCRLPRSCSNVR